MSLLSKTTSYYKLDESSGNASDSVGANTLTNNGTITYSAGKINNGASLGTSNTTKYFSTTSALGLTSGAFGISFWVKINTAPSNSTQTLVSWSCATGSGGLRVKIDYLDTAGTKTLRFNRSKPTVADQAVDYNTTLTVGTWYHIVMSYDTTNEVGYLNGSQVATNAASGTGTNSGVTNFGRLDVGSQYASADLDEIAITTGDYFTSTDVTSLYNGGIGFQYPFTAKTAGFFMF